MATQLAPQLGFDAPLIPDRLYFKIGDVARICEVKTYVLRFWETQFPQLKPNKSGTGQRLYRRRDVEMALEIKRLVHGEGFTLAGARQAMEQVHRRHEPQAMLPLLEAVSGQPLDDVAITIGQIRAELREIAKLLASPEPQPQRRRAKLATVPTPSGFLFPS